MTAARLDGIFGVKLPVRDLAVSRAWYERLFDLRLRAEFPDDDGVVRELAYEIPGVPGVDLALRETSGHRRALRIRSSDLRGG